jgi:hypothetical protein
MENVPIGQNQEIRSEVPGRPAGKLCEKEKTTPEKNQYREGDHEFLGGCESEEIARVKQKQIEEDIVPLADGGQAGELMVFDQLREPGVINVAAQIAGLNARMPEARNEQQDGKQNDWNAMGAKKSAGRWDCEGRHRPVGRISGHSGGGSASILHGPR